MPGLHIALDVVTASAERRLFNMPGGFPATLGGGGRSGLPLHPSRFPADMFRLINAVRDSGLLVELVQPDYSFNLRYAQGGSFQAHRDSPHRWGHRSSALAAASATRAAAPSAPRRPRRPPAPRTPRAHHTILHDVTACMM